ncbi:MAG TPA: YceI family protein [Marinagarivorans sp.]
MLSLTNTTPLKALLLSGIISSALIGSSALADWTINNETSAVQFVSIKNGSIGETHRFSQVSGTLSKAGALTATITLGSVDTGIEIRDIRMKDVLFETPKFPSATITAQVAPAMLKSLKTGKSTNAQVPFELDLHGQKVELLADVIITQQKGGKLLVTTASPILLNAAEFGLVDGINTLKTLAGLDSIATSVPVTVQLTLEQ